MSVLVCLPDTDTPTPTLTTGLNDPQRQAVEHADGALLVLAGAGTGKTRVLTHRLASLLKQRAAQPWQVLAVTFTNKAAREMKERVTHLVGGAAESIWLGTFHSLCAKLLRRHAEILGFTPQFTILDTDDSQRLMKQLLDAEGIDSKQTPPRLVLSIIDRWKDRGLTPDEVPTSERRNQLNGKAIGLYQHYQERLKTLNAMDFGDLLLNCLHLFKLSPDTLRKYQDQFHYILVDEYQDTNTAQYLWLRLLAQGHGNICCVGDDDQSIYSWRGAQIENILKFERDFPGALVVRLEQNYRSTHHILGAASGLIANNSGRLGKTLWTQETGGEKVRLISALDGSEEARRIGEEIEHLRRSGTALAHMAILVRAGYQTREFEERLLQIAVPYRVLAGQRFYDRAEIKDAIAYLRLIFQPRDDLAFERIINTPRRGISLTTIQHLQNTARNQGCSLLAAIASTPGLRPGTSRALAGFSASLNRWREMASALPPADLLKNILEESGYTAMLQAEDTPEAKGRLDNLKELARAIDEFQSLAAFLEHISLVTDAARADNPEAVTIMTLHAAKGLEFPVVFLPGWEEGVFPSQRSVDDGNLEEERRLAYVGLTRAREHAYISHAHSRRIYGSWQGMAPSRFIGELNKEHLKNIT
ncbi:MAG: ATP-dependent helicase [Holosporales bacterium]|jgi:DNA helicase-2/ATP-dependent DNA helicase PcrA